MNKKLGLIVVAAGLLAGPMAANAVPFSFSCVTGNSATNCATGANQLVLDVTDAGGGSTDFRFSNTGLLDSSIADIYFDWLNAADTLPQGTITDSGAGVSFSWGAAPANLPGGNGINFTANLGADSNAPVQPNGVNPGEWVNFRFTGSFADILADLNSGALRVGIHTQGFDDGGSESFVNVPEPGTIAMLGIGLLGLGASRRRRTI